MAMKHVNPILWGGDGGSYAPTLHGLLGDMDDNAGPNLAAGSGLGFTVYNLFLIHLRPMS